ncbi:MAG: spore cortex biosynthesis protein YabQ [Clostridia bacterium]|nr:spore cortex biosynthesis protein YabQ [Clostridia bacterium]
MGFTNAEQLRELFLSGGMGFLLGVYYDAFRILRRLLHSSKLSVFFQDLFFFATAAVAVFLFSLAMTDGVVRAYVLVGCTIGFFAYRYTVGKLLLQGVCRVLTITKRFYTRLCNLVSRPFRRVFRLLSGAFGKLRKICEKNTKKSRLFLKKVLQPIGKVLYNHRV